MKGGTVAILQARMSSTRLPGKILKPVQGRPLLWYQLQRVRRARTLDRIVVATTTSAADDPVVTFCREQGCDFVRGPEHDVLERYAMATRQFSADTVVRLTSDCPLLPAPLVDQAVERFRAGQPCDYLSNMREPSYPYGFAVEVMHANALLEAATAARDPQEREHVTPFLYWHPERYCVVSMRAERDLSHHRWTVDTPEDFELVSRILAALYDTNPEFGTPDVLALLARHPDWSKINAHVEQKVLQLGASEKR